MYYTSVGDSDNGGSYACGGEQIGNLSVSTQLGNLCVSTQFCGGFKTTLKINSIKNR